MSDSGRDLSDSDDDKRSRRIPPQGGSGTAPASAFAPEHNDDSGRKSLPVMAAEAFAAAREAVQKSSIRHHSGNKYLRRIKPADGEGKPIWVDVYAVIKAFAVTGAGQQHAIKKILCAGIRGKGDSSQDLQEAVDSLYRAIEQEKEDANDA